MSIDYSRPLTIEASFRRGVVVKPPISVSGLDALVLLREDHKRVNGCLNSSKSQRRQSHQRKRDHVGEICKVAIHPTAEEEIFYSAVRAALAQDGEDLLMT